MKSIITPWNLFFISGILQTPMKTSKITPVMHFSITCNSPIAASIYWGKTKLEATTGSGTKFKSH